MKWSKTYKKIVPVILSCTMLSQISPVRCQTSAEIAISKSKFWTLMGITGTVMACLTAGVIYEFNDACKKQDKIEKLEREIKNTQPLQGVPQQMQCSSRTTNNLDIKIAETPKLHIVQNGEKSAAENLQEAWYITYYCVTKGIVDNYDAWMKIAKKCIDFSNSNMKIRTSLNGLLKHSNRKNISECDFIFNIMVATYLSVLPIGALENGIPIEFFPLLWLDRCNFQVSGNDQTFETCKKLTIDLFTETAKCFNAVNPKEAELRDMLQKEFIDILKNI